VVVTAEMDRTSDEALFIYFCLLNDAVSITGCVAEDNEMRINTAVAKDMEGDGCCEYETLQKNLCEKS